MTLRTRLGLGGRMMRGPGRAVVLPVELAASVFCVDNSALAVDTDELAVSDAGELLESAAGVAEAEAEGLVTGCGSLWTRIAA